MLDTWTTRAQDERRGRVELTIWQDRRARAAHCVRTRPARTFEGALADWVLPELLEHLNTAGFPGPRATPTAVRVALLSVATRDGPLQMWLSPGHRVTQAYDRAVLLLEGVVHALSRGALTMYPALPRRVLPATGERAAVMRG